MALPISDKERKSLSPEDVEYFGPGRGQGRSDTTVLSPTSLGMGPALQMLRSSPRKPIAGCSGWHMPQETACSAWFGHGIQERSWTDRAIFLCSSHFSVSWFHHLSSSQRRMTKHFLKKEMIVLFKAETLQSFKSSVCPSQFPERIPVGPGGRSPSTVIPSQCRFNVEINGMKGFSQAEEHLNKSFIFYPRTHKHSPAHPQHSPIEM